MGAKACVARACASGANQVTAPVPVDEMVEVFAYLEAAEESKRRGGSPVALDDVKERARKKS